VVGSWALPGVFKEEGAGGAPASRREGTASRCESRPWVAAALARTEAERSSAWAAGGWQRCQKQNRRGGVAAGPKPK